MFKKQKKSLPTAPASVVGTDFIVHNMPVPRVSPIKTSAESRGGNNLEASGLELSGPKHNFKAVGFIIIIAGLVVISVFIYLSYRFIVKPKTNIDSPSIVATTTGENIPSDQAASSSAVDVGADSIMATTSEIATVTPDIISVATSSASSTLGANSAGTAENNLLPVIDTDVDGLFDDEEAVLGTLSTSADSDADNYGDLAELQKGYNPAGTGKLETNLYLSKYSNTAFKYETLIPKSWSAQSWNNEATEVFTAPDQSLIQISVQENSDKISILNWYGQSFPDSPATYDRLASTDSYDGIMGEDGLNFYLIDKDKKYIIVATYIPVASNHLAYPNIFKLIIDSLVIK